MHHSKLSFAPNYNYFTSLYPIDCAKVLLTKTYHYYNYHNYAVTVRFLPVCQVRTLACNCFLGLLLTLRVLSLEQTEQFISLCADHVAITFIGLYSLLFLAFLKV